MEPWMVIPILFALPPLTALSLVIYAVKLTDQLETERRVRIENKSLTESIIWIDSDRIEKV